MNETPTTEPSPEIAQVMARFVEAYIAEGQEKPQPVPLTDEWLVAYWVHGQVGGVRTPGDCVSRAAAMLTEYRKRYPKPV